MRTPISPLAVMLALALPAIALGQSSGNFTLRKSVVAGGVVAQGGSYRLTATATLVGAVQTGGAYRLTSGFHAPRDASDRLLCNGFEATPCP